MSRVASSTSWSSAACRSSDSVGCSSVVPSEQKHAPMRSRAAALCSRRAVLGAVLALGGCGFRPMYGEVETNGGAFADIAPELAAVRVGYLGERYGVQVRRALQRRLEAVAPGTPARYTLDVSLGVTGEVLGYRRDGAISRVRYIATSNWNLMTLAVPPQTIARSEMPVRTIDAFNVPDLQFFSADTSREAMESRLADVISDEIYRQVALALRRYLKTGPRPASGAITPAPAGLVPGMDAEPPAGMPAAPGTAPSGGRTPSTPGPSL